MSVYAPHPWDAVPASPPKPGATYEDEPVGRLYVLTFEYEAIVEVVNASDVSEAEIEKALAESHAIDIDEQGRSRIADETRVYSGHVTGTPDYRVRIVDGGAETL